MTTDLTEETSPKAQTPLDDAGSLSELSVTAAIAAMRDGHLTSEAYGSALIQKARAQTGLNAFITIDEDAVMNACREADQVRRTGSAAPLLGIPFGVKDSYATAGLRTTLGVANLDDYVPQHDADIVQSVKAAGGIVFGKNNLVEMSWGLTGANDTYGQVGNVNDSEHVSGGSSSGSAVAVAAGIVPASFGGDTVGSIRVPASLNGIVGFKPTTARWPRGGVAPISHVLDTTGLLARSVADCIVVDGVITGGPTIPRPAADDLAGVTLAYAPNQYLGLIDSTIENAFTHAVQQLREAGARVVEVDLGPDFSDLAGGLTWSIFFRETRRAIIEFLRQNDVPATFDDIYSELRPQLKEAWSFLVLPSGDGYLSDADFDRALWTDRPALQHRFQTMFEAHHADALILPTTPAVAPRIDSRGNFTVAGTEVDDLFLARNTVPASGAGLPGITLPLSETAEGLSFGIELDGQLGDDRHLLDVAHLVERILSGKRS